MYNCSSVYVSQLPSPLFVRKVTFVRIMLPDAFRAAKKYLIPKRAAKTSHVLVFCSVRVRLASAK